MLSHIYQTEAENKSAVLCGYARPEETKLYHSETNIVKVRFSSNGYSEHNGFLASFAICKKSIKLNIHIGFQSWPWSWLSSYLCFTCRFFNSNMDFWTHAANFYLILFKSSDPETCPSYCKNNGVCEFSYVNGVSCDCTGTEYIGKTCESNSFIPVSNILKLSEMTCLANQGRLFEAFGFFTIRKSDTFLSDYLTDLKLHSTKKISSKIVPNGVWTHDILIISLILCQLS